MDDIAPALLQELLEAFETELAKDGTAAELLEKIHAGKSGYAEVGDYADRVGSALANAFHQHLSSAVLPDGKMYWNIADRVVRTLLGRDYELVVDAAKTAQLHLNAKAGIGIKPQTAPLNESRVDGILQVLAAAEQYDEAAASVLSEPVLQTYSRSVADETLEVNLQMQHRAGLNPRIIRRATARACKWCRALEGSFDYPDDMPADVFRRHDNCKCRVEYDPGSGRRQTVHSGTEGKRTYVKDEYGVYTQTSEARIKHAQEMESTETERKEADRQKRIDTWVEKKDQKQTSSEVKKTVEPDLSVLKDRLRRQVLSLPKDQQEALRQYTGFAATRINSAIANDRVTTKIQREIDILHDALKDGILPETVVVHRDTSAVFLGLSIPSDPSERKLQALVGQTFTNKSFTSTSFQNLQLQGRDTELYFTVPAGYRGCRYLEPVAFPKYKYQDELLFDQGLSYRVEEVSFISGKLIIYAEVIQ